MSTIIIETQQLINSSLDELKRLRGLGKEWREEFCEKPPILWFGDIKSSKPKVVVISANPSNTEYAPKGKPHIPSAKGWNISKPDIAKLEDDYNRYFSNNPYTRWFGANPADKSLKKNRTGCIEDFLNGLDASFYGNKKYQAIHIDLMPFPTTNSFVDIADKLMTIPDFPHWIDSHIKEMIALIQPKLIIINGRTNFRYFNLCVNLGAQPYSTVIHNNSTTIWLANPQPDRAPVIGVSANMGSRYMGERQTLINLGKFVKKQIKLL